MDPVIMDVETRRLKPRFYPIDAPERVLALSRVVRVAAAVWRGPQTHA